MFQDHLTFWGREASHAHAAGLQPPEATPDCFHMGLIWDLCAIYRDSIWFNASYGKFVEKKLTRWMLYPSLRESPILSGWWLQLCLVCQPWKLNGMMIRNDEHFFFRGSKPWTWWGPKSNLGEQIDIIYIWLFLLM